MHGKPKQAESVWARQKLVHQWHALALFAVVCVASNLSAQPAILDGIVLEPFAVKIFQPTSISHAGDGSGRLFVTSQQGQISVIENGETLQEPFLDVTSKVSCCSERGLLNIVFHPDYGVNGFFYIFYTDVNGHSIISRFSVSAAPNRADPNSETLVISVPQPGRSHNGGGMAFGPDGYLYIGVGDGGATDNEAQDKTTLLGAILRLDVDAAQPYAIPDSNPFVAFGPERAELWAVGVRNPWRISFDRLTGDLFIGDVGAKGVEEINFLPADSAGGLNYGWSRLEGSQCWRPEDGNNCHQPSDVPPILESNHRGDPCSGSISGGYRYRGSAIPALDAIYLFGDYCTGRLHLAVENGGEWSVLETRETGKAISTFGEDEAGELYIGDHDTGNIVRIAVGTPSPGFTVVSGASFEPQAVAPGEIINVFGTGVGTGPVTVGEVLDGTLRDRNAGSQVLFGDVPAPIIFTSEDQIGAIVPFAVAGQENAQVRVELHRRARESIDLNVVAAAPAIFSLNQSGRGQGAILNQDFAINGPARPAARGSTVAIFATGAGQTSPEGNDGRLAFGTLEELPRPLLPVGIRIGGVDAQVAYAGAAPLLIEGVLQVNAVVPNAAPTGSSVSLELFVGGAASQSGITMAVE